MILRWIILAALMVVPLNGYRKCPRECRCENDVYGVPSVTCSEGGMTSIPITQFNPNVEELYIEGSNNLTIGPIFLDLKKLRILRIVDSNIPAIGQNSFLGLVFLRFLDLSQNNISTIGIENFKGLQNLWLLNLSKNKIESIPSASFSPLKDLRTLDLSDNLIEGLGPRQFIELNRLTTLILSGNPIITLPIDVFADVQTLTIFKCRNCSLKKLDAEFFKLFVYLREVDLGDNRIEMIDFDHFTNLRKLKFLRLDGNQLTQINQLSFEFQVSLEWLDLSRNQIRYISEYAFTGLNNLTSLDLSYNELQALPSIIFEQFNNLTIFNVSGNSLIDVHELKEIFKVINSLDSLGLADMKIAFPVDILKPLYNLKKLNISGNDYKKIPLKMLSYVELSDRLELFDISNNQLTGITENELNFLMPIRYVGFENNPFICDECHVGALIKRATDMNWSLFPKCFFPENLREMPINALEIDALVDCYEYDVSDAIYTVSRSSTVLNTPENAGLYAVIGIFALICILLVTMCLLSRHGAKYYTHEDKIASNLEKNADGTHINGKEINFKFPLDDEHCIIDDICMPPPPPTPTKTKKGAIIM